MAVNFSTGYLPPWASLPVLALFSVLDKLLEPIDHVCFAAVCTEWRFAAKHYNHATRRWHKLLPMLLIPSECQGKTSLTNPKLLYSISEGKICNNIKLQVPYGKRCIGSSHGWLATADVAGHRHGLNIVLRNPFRKAGSIRLPPLEFKIEKRHKGYHEFYIQKVILSADPLLNPESYVVGALYDLYNYKLAFIRGGQTQWAYIKDDEVVYTDVIFYKSQIYAAKMRGGIVALDVSSSFNCSRPPKAKELKAQDVRSYSTLKSYLVESTNGDLLQVQRFYKCKSGPTRKMDTVDFMVYKLVFSDEDGSTMNNVRVQSIGDEALFVGDNHSVSVLASNFPTCQPNSIYYTDDWIALGLPELPDGPWDDMGIFNLEEKTITQHYSLNPNLQCYIPPAIWVVPQFNGLC